jgi:hypothetical protein
MTRDEIAQVMQDTSGSYWGDEPHFQRFAERLLKAEPEQRCEYIRSSGTTHWCALAEAGPKEKNNA